MCIRNFKKLIEGDEAEKIYVLIASNHPQAHHMIRLLTDPEFLKNRIEWARRGIEAKKQKKIEEEKLKKQKMEEERKRKQEEAKEKGGGGGEEEEEGGGAGQGGGCFEFVFGEEYCREEGNNTKTS